MKKYDLSKTEEFIHEFIRMCESSSCYDCGMKYKGSACYLGMNEVEILDIVKMWSGENPENPEKPTLTRMERDFIEAFAERPDERYIFRSEDGAWISIGVQDIRLSLPFESIPVGESVPIKTLLTWEVSDD